LGRRRPLGARVAPAPRRMPAWYSDLSYDRRCPRSPCPPGRDRRPSCRSTCPRQPGLSRVCEVSYAQALSVRSRRAERDERGTLISISAERHAPIASRPDLPGSPWSLHVQAPHDRQPRAPARARFPLRRDRARASGDAPKKRPRQKNVLWNVPSETTRRARRVTTFPPPTARGLALSAGRPAGRRRQPLYG
jgi:hypothetical protein